MLPLVILFPYFMIVICGVAAVIFMILYFTNWEESHDHEEHHEEHPGAH